LRPKRHDQLPSVPKQHVRRVSRGEPPLWTALLFSAAFGAATVAAVFAREPIHAVGTLAGMTLAAFATAFDRPGIIQTLAEVLKSRRDG
jgi:ABC-type phosphate/phosphonate transport system permease subunit